MKQLILIMLTGALTACATPAAPPHDAVPGRIAIVAETESPFWTSMIRSEIPPQINKRARYELVNSAETNPFKLRVSIFNSDRWISGYDRRGDPEYGVRVEVKAVLVDPGGKQIWKWSGWYQHNSTSRAMANIGVLMGKQLETDGLLEPAFYRGAGDSKR